MSASNPVKDYWQSLLRIKVPLTVTLAQKRMPVEQVLQFIPGVMIQFDKPCDHPMVIEVGGQGIAEGEVVKVGDKFGIRVTEVLQRDERFHPLRKCPNSPPTRNNRCQPPCVGAGGF